MTVCTNGCRRRSKANARTEDVPRALLCYMRGWAQVGKAALLHPLWPPSPALALAKLTTVYAEVGHIFPEIRHS